MRELTLAAGGLLVLTSVLVSPEAVLTMLRPEDAPTPSILSGGRLFTSWLLVVGTYLAVMSRLPLWSAPIARSRKGHGRKALAAVVVLLAASAILRLYGLDRGLWYDEVAMHVKYATRPFGEIVTTYDSEGQHLLYSVLAHVSLALFGESAWALRLPAALFGVASIWAVYLLGRRLAAPGEALLAAALLAFSYHHIWFSQNARGYTALLLFAVLTSHLLLRALDENRTSVWMLYAAGVALGVYTHVTMLFVVLAQVVLYGLRWRGMLASGLSPWTGLVAGFGLAAVLTVGLHALVLPQFLGTIGQDTTVLVWKQPLWTLLETVNGIRIGFTGSVMAVAATLLFVAGCVSYGRREPALLYLLGIPIVAGAALVLAMGHPLWPRFFFFVTGFVVLIVIRGARTLGAWATIALRVSRPRPVAVGTAMAAGLVLLSSASVPAVYAPKQDYLGARDFVEAHRRPDDAVVLVGLARFPYTQLYRATWRSIETVDELQTVTATSRRTWVVYTLPVHLEHDYPEIMTTIHRAFPTVQRFPGSLRGGTIFVARHDGIDAAARGDSETKP